MAFVVQMPTMPRSPPGFKKLCANFEAQHEAKHKHGYHIAAFYCIMLQDSDFQACSPEPTAALPCSVTAPHPLAQCGDDH